MGLDKKLESLNIQQLNNTKKNNFKIKKCSTKSLFGYNKYEEKLYKPNYNNPYIYIHKMNRTKSLLSLKENTFKTKIDNCLKQYNMIKTKLLLIKTNIKDIKKIKHNSKIKSDNKDYFELLIKTIDFYKSMINKFTDNRKYNHYLNNEISKTISYNNELKRKITELSMKINQIEKDSGV